MEKKSDIQKGYRKMACEEFQNYRYSYKMSQKEWAEAVGISTALVKQIETRKRDCSAKTAGKVWEFIGANGAAHRAGSGPMELEERILYDIFLGHMEKLAGREAAGYAAKCIRPLQKALSKASECSSPDAQKKYFDFLEAFLSAMQLAASEYASLADDGEAMPDLRDGLTGFAGKQIRKIRQGGNQPVPEKQDGDGQYSLFL